MNGIFLVVEMLVVFYIISQKWMLLLVWILPCMMQQMSYYYGNERIYLEIIEDYPIADCIKPRRCKFLFRKLDKLSYKDIPKEMYYSELTRIIGFSIYSIVVVFLLLLSEDTHLACLVGYVYIWWEIFVIILSGIILSRKTFLARYKRLNRYNFKYLFLSENKPYPHKVGMCKVVRERKRGKIILVTVSIIETGEIKEKVLLQGGKRVGKEPVYSLYEICKVYYII